MAIVPPADRWQRAQVRSSDAIAVPCAAGKVRTLSRGLVPARARSNRLEQGGVVIEIESTQYTDPKA
jgi:hypothetical protein